jgi:glutathione S-transferase
MTLKIYGTAKSRASRNLWLAKEIGLPFEHVEIVQSYNKTRDDQVLCRDASFLAINPNGHIPAIDDDGLILWESLAINQHLARKYGGKLGPADASEEALVTMWSLWAANECEVNTLAILQKGPTAPAGKQDKAATDAAVAALKAPFAVLDKALANNNGHLVGNRLTVADINVATVVLYARGAEALFAQAPHVKAWLDGLTGRPAYKEMMKLREA